MPEDPKIPEFSSLSEEERRKIMVGLTLGDQSNRPEERQSKSTREALARLNFSFWLGFPIESNPRRLKIFPWITLSLIFLATFISLLAFMNPLVLERFAFIPDNGKRLYGLTMFSCFFVHGNWFHLLSNMYCLFIFGDNVESSLGRIKFFSLVLGATVFGSILSGVADPHSTIWHIGASGGIFGIMAYYLLRFPGTKFTYRYFFHPFEVRASWLLVLYATLQLIGAVGQLGRTGGGIGYLAHLGGGFIGFIFWLVDRKLKKPVRAEH
jgi:membrane associated rhomboid family serine protease